MLRLFELPGDGGVQARLDLFPRAEDAGEEGRDAVPRVGLRHAVHGDARTVDGLHARYPVRVHVHEAGDNRQRPGVDLRLRCR